MCGGQQDPTNMPEVNPILWGQNGLRVYLQASFRVRSFFRALWLSENPGDHRSPLCPTRFLLRLVAETEYYGGPWLIGPNIVSKNS